MPRDKKQPDEDQLTTHEALTQVLEYIDECMNNTTTHTRLQRVHALWTVQEFVSQMRDELPEFERHIV